MTKSEAINKFWSSFGIPAYEENSLPDGLEFPYITYQFTADRVRHPVFMSAALWWRSTSLAPPMAKVDEISRKLGTSGVALPVDGGSVVIKQGHPFCMGTIPEPSDSAVKHILLQITAEYFTNY